MRKDDEIFQQCALLIEYGQFAAALESRIDGQDTFIPQRGLQQQATQVGAQKIETAFSWACSVSSRRFRVPNWEAAIVRRIVENLFEEFSM